MKNEAKKPSPTFGTRLGKNNRNDSSNNDNNEKIKEL